MANALPKLEFDYAALAPHLSEENMTIHHSKHHQAYVNNLNNALEAAGLLDKDINDILKDLGSVPEAQRAAVTNHGGGHVNHALFWTCLNPNGGGAPSGALATAIDAKWGSYDEFKKQFSDNAAKLFGSGWTWLAADAGGLSIVNTPNQITPLSEGKTPILTLDVWEHAYYPTYQNRRPDFIGAFWEIVNWKSAEERFASIG